MNNEKRPGDDGRIYITQGPPPKRKAPPEGSEAAMPRKTHERTLNMVLLLSFVLFGAVLLTFIAVFALSSKGSYAMPSDTKDAPGSDIGVVADPDTVSSHRRRAPDIGSSGSYRSASKDKDHYRDKLRICRSH